MAEQNPFIQTHNELAFEYATGENQFSILPEYFARGEFSPESRLTTAFEVLERENEDGVEHKLLDCPFLGGVFEVISTKVTGSKDYSLLYFAFVSPTCTFLLHEGEGVLLDPDRSVLNYDTRSGIVKTYPIECLADVILAVHEFSHRHLIPIEALSQHSVRRKLFTSIVKGDLDSYFVYSDPTAALIRDLDRNFEPEEADVYKQALFSEIEDKFVYRLLLDEGIANRLALSVLRNMSRNGMNGDFESREFLLEAESLLAYGNATVIRRLVGSVSFRFCDLFERRTESYRRFMRWIPGQYERRIRNVVRQKQGAAYSRTTGNGSGEIIIEVDGRRRKVRKFALH